MKLFMQVIALSVALLIASGPVRGAESEQLVYRTPQGVEFTITREGLNSVRYQQRELAHGHWSLFNADAWFSKKGEAAVKIGKVEESRCEPRGEREARVTHRQGDVSAIYDYSFEGEDLTISCHVENHADAAIGASGFGGLEFAFARTGRLDADTAYLVFHGPRLAVVPSEPLFAHRRQLCRGRPDRRRCVAVADRLDADLAAVGL